jgi:glycerate dehydrogenase
MSKPVIVITDGYTLNPGDLSWEGLKEFGEIQYYDRSEPGEVAARCREAHVIVTNKTLITKAVIEMASQLKLITVAATGYNIVDTVAARSRGVPVCNVPEYGTYSVAQHTMSLILELSNHVGMNALSVANGGWSSCPDFCYTEKPIIELHGKTLGIIGMGRIGLRLAFMAVAFGMKIIYHSQTPKKDWPDFVSVEEIFKQSDFISVHCPLTQENSGFINHALLSSMKPTAFLINTSRGALINESDLAGALKEKKLAGAALDVLGVEPPPEDHPLVGLPNCLITPHNAWLSKEARQRIMQTTIDNVRLALAGTPQNLVN